MKDGTSGDSRPGSVTSCKERTSWGSQVDLGAHLCPNIYVFGFSDHVRVLKPGLSAWPTLDKMAESWSLT